MNTFFTNHSHPTGELRFDEGGVKHLKVTFPQDQAGFYEHMWVRVDSFDARVGVLNQDPTRCSYVKDTDRVEFVHEPHHHRYLFTRKV